MIRLFVALKIADEVKSEIFRHAFAAAENPSDYRWEAKDKVHLTLKFIGDVRDELLQQIINELEFVKKYPTFNCKISGFGFFFRNTEAKILWCNLNAGESLISLAEELNIKLQKFDIKAEKRKFQGHLTLLRIKRGVSENFVRKVKEYKFTPVTFRANEVALIQSVLKPAGSEYKVLKIYELK
jgi:2'-5' RNA ligase